MQNKANFLKSQMNANKVLTKVYENKTLGGSGKNKANSKPNKANSKPISPETNPIQTQYKAKQTQFQRQKNARCKAAGLVAAVSKKALKMNRPVNPKDKRLLTSLRGYGKCTK